MNARPVSWSYVRARDSEGLTPMERKVVDRERQGLSRPVIAAVLGLSVATVALHLWKASQRGVRLRKKLRRYRRWTATERRTLTKHGAIRKGELVRVLETARAS